MATKTKYKLKLIEELRKEFPKAWFKDGMMFDGNENCLVWTGEESMFDEYVPLFDYYSQMFNIFPDAGVHFKLKEFLESRGLFCECHDPGTYLIYKI